MINISYSHEYPEIGKWVIYETSFIENNKTFYYIGSHLPTQKRDTYCGSSKKIKELKKLNYPLNFKILYTQQKDENRFEIEGKFIKEYYKKYKEYCININLDPSTNRSIRWSLERLQKFKQTNLERFGTEQPFASESVKQKIKETNLEHYGVEYPMQSSEIREKSKKTLQEKYNVTNISQVDSIRQKKHEIMMEKTEDEWEKIDKKRKQTMQKRYGKKFYNNREKCVKACLNKYGVKNTFASKEIQEKIKQTNIKKFGVANPNQSPEIIKKRKETKEIQRHQNKPLHKADFYRVWTINFNNQQNLFFNQYVVLDFLKKFGIKTNNKTDKQDLYSLMHLTKQRIFYSLSVSLTKINNFEFFQKFPNFLK